MNDNVWAGALQDNFPTQQKVKELEHEITELHSQLQKQETLTAQIQRLKADEDALCQKIKALKTEKLHIEQERDSYAQQIIELQQIEDKMEGASEIDAPIQTTLTPVEIDLLRSTRIVIIGGHDTCINR